jgi:hypothetical protein
MCSIIFVIPARSTELSIRKPHKNTAKENNLNEHRETTAKVKYFEFFLGKSSAGIFIALKGLFKLKLNLWLTAPKGATPVN